MKRLTNLTRTAQRTLNTIKDMLEYKPSTCAYIAEELDMTASYVRECLSTLYKAGQTHIVGWQKEPHGVSAMYSLGSGIDAERILVRKNRANKSVIKSLPVIVPIVPCPVHAAFFGKSL